MVTFCIKLRSKQLPPDRNCKNSCFKGHDEKARGKVLQHVEWQANKVISPNLHIRAIGAQLHQQRANEAARVSWSWRDVNLSRHLNEYSTRSTQKLNARARPAKRERRSLSAVRVFGANNNVRAVGRMAFVMWCCIICIDKSHPHAVGGLVYITRARGADNTNESASPARPPARSFRVSFTREAASAIWCNNIYPST